MSLVQAPNSPEADLPKVIRPTVHGILHHFHAGCFTAGVVCVRSHNNAAARA